MQLLGIREGGVGFRGWCRGQTTAKFICWESGQLLLRAVGSDLVAV